MPKLVYFVAYFSISVPAVVYRGGKMDIIEVL